MFKLALLSILMNYVFFHYVTNFNVNSSLHVKIRSVLYGRKASKLPLEAKILAFGQADFSSGPLSTMRGDLGLGLANAQSGIRSEASCLRDLDTHKGGSQPCA